VLPAKSIADLVAAAEDVFLPGINFVFVKGGLSFFMHKPAGPDCFCFRHIFKGKTCARQGVAFQPFSFPVTSQILFIVIAFSQCFVSGLHVAQGSEVLEK
jgi:hypothetical protein